MVICASSSNRCLVGFDVRLGRLWKFKLADVDAWVRRGGATEDEAPSSTEDPE